MAPVRSRLKVRDLAKVFGFYQRTLGLTRIAESGGAVTLGTATTPLLELMGDLSLATRDPQRGDGAGAGGQNARHDRQQRVH